LKGHEGGIRAVVFSPDGRRLAAASGEAPVYLWDVCAGLPAPGKLSGKDLECCWSDLAAADATAAFHAVHRLRGAPAEALPFLRQRMKPAAAPDAGHMRRLLAGLESPKFTERQRATADLEKLGDAAADLLRKSLAQAASAEARQRLERLLEKM